LVNFDWMNWVFGHGFIPGSEPECGSGELLDIRVGAKLRSRRIELGISTGQASGSCGISRALLAAYERGEIRLAPTRLIALSELLDVDVGYFFP